MVGFNGVLRRYCTGNLDQKNYFAHAVSGRHQLSEDGGFIPWVREKAVFAHPFHPHGGTPRTCVLVEHAIAVVHETQIGPVGRGAWKETPSRENKVAPFLDDDGDALSCHPMIVLQKRTQKAMLQQEKHDCAVCHWKQEKMERDPRGSISGAKLQWIFIGFVSMHAFDEGRMPEARVPQRLPQWEGGPIDPRCRPGGGVRVVWGGRGGVIGIDRSLNEEEYGERKNMWAVGGNRMIQKPVGKSKFFA